ncbi:MULTISPECIES: hypothetical protein [Methanobrevibacter]|jgi:hypothetical protein|uniref:Uncharacterized protein n=1 Tax=Methanobrevibacter smithii (strain ATCC 35061 / DSM 861 / OCM 144 / PS) TaxID=420247 RepID=A5UL21_METS3|nr:MULTISPECIES: hypothetical protein [Methanobrevibacter]ABQ86899.1 hypothetical protein Msm_0694 [Methanobrevibacter smithii ATCC 35061]
MTKINLEIIDYIREADFDENLKNFFISAILYELRNPEKMHYKASYENMIENVMGE